MYRGTRARCASGIMHRISNRIGTEECCIRQGPGSFWRNPRCPAVHTCHVRRCFARGSPRSRSGPATGWDRGRPPRGRDVADLKPAADAIGKPVEAMWPDSDNGTEALECALSQDVAIVLLDVDMPGMDGFSVCRRLRAEPRLATVPIVMVTGHEDSAAITLAFEAGATDFISKPVNWALLPHRLKYILRNASAAERIERRERSQSRLRTRVVPHSRIQSSTRGSSSTPPQASGSRFIRMTATM